MVISSLFCRNRLALLAAFGLFLLLWQALLSGPVQPGLDDQDFPTPTLALEARVEQFARLAKKSAPEAAQVLQALAVPHDEIGLKGKQTLRVVPTAEYLGSPGTFAGKVKVKEIDTDGKAGKQRELTKADVLAWKPYEQIALEGVLALRQEADVPELERLAAAQAVLVAVWHYHLMQRDRPALGSNPWQKLEDRLDKQLLQVRLESLEKSIEQAKQKNLKTKVLPFAGQLVKVYPDTMAVKTQAALARAKFAEMLLAEEQFRQAEEWLAQAEQLRPDLPQVKTLRQKFQDQLPLPKGKPVLRVGVRTLPEFFAPPLAWTDAEKLAVEMLFESLVLPSASAPLGQYYQPGLAAALPKVLASGRRFTLRPDAFWSNGERVTVADVRSTTELLRQFYFTGEGFTWNELIGSPRFTGNPGQVEFPFNQAFFDPLLPFTFKVLPQTYQGKPLHADQIPAFARNPVGSGPFLYLKPETAENGGPVRFVVNKFHPYARQKSGFSEIQFHLSKDPVAELTDPQSPLHLILGLTEEQLAQLKKYQTGSIKNLDNRRVYFLALNHRKSALQDRDLRKGLAAAINRQLILDHCFRGDDPAYGLLEAAGAGLAVAGNVLQGKIATRHQPLTGPFPAESWACRPELPARLHDPDQALILLRKVKERQQPLALTLVHPGDDPRVAQACKLMAEQIHAVARKAEFSLQIQLKPLAPRQLWEAVYNHDYDLAYFHWDHASEYYWLWPLFDTDEKALAKMGSNFLGYDDAGLAGQLRIQMSHRDFGQLKKVTHDIHYHLHDRMPLVPLWQLDQHIALHPQLAAGELAAWPGFANLTQWKWKQ